MEKLLPMISCYIVNGSTHADASVGDRWDAGTGAQARTGGWTVTDGAARRRRRRAAQTRLTRRVLSDEWGQVRKTLMTQFTGNLRPNDAVHRKYLLFPSSDVVCADTNRRYISGADGGGTDGNSSLDQGERHNRRSEPSYTSTPPNLSETSGRELEEGV